MTQADRKEFAKILKGLALSGIFFDVLSKRRIDLYFEVFKDVPLEDIKKGAEFLQKEL